MKKLGTMIILSGLFLTAMAGETPKKNFMAAGDGEKCFDESSHIVSIGCGFGGYSSHSFYHGAGYSYGRTPNFNVSYEQPWPQKLGPGYLGVGAFLAYQHEHYDYDNVYVWTNTNYYYHHDWNYYMIAARAVYHWDVLNAKNAEVYAGVLAGVSIQTHHYETNDPGKHDPYNYTEGAVSPAYNIFAGARWYFVPSVGLFAEAGYGISYARIGVSFKF
ncbi:MAG: hypothetical protein ACJ77K_08650 [Bacteroidia bacterium]